MSTSVRLRIQPDPTPLPQRLHDHRMAYCPMPVPVKAAIMARFRHAEALPERALPADAEGSLLIGDQL